MTGYQRVLRHASRALLAILLGLFTLPRAVYGQAPTADNYEENDTLVAASSIPATITLPNMTIVPAQDVDFYRIVANPAPSWHRSSARQAWI